MAVRYVIKFLVALSLFIVSTHPVARADSLPERAYISGVSGHRQKFTLSCESRSAVDWAAFWGVHIREKKFQRSLPRSDNPDKGFVGNSNAAWGNVPPNAYGVHAEPVAALLREYGLQAEARRGISWDDLRVEVAAGRPVIVWVVGQMWRGTPIKYRASDGHKTTVARYEHTMIVIGYGPHKVHVVDAYSGQTQSYPVGRFLASWKTLGRMAVVGQKAPVIEPMVDPLVDAHSIPQSAYFPPSELLLQRTFLPAVFRGHGQ